MTHSANSQARLRKAALSGCVITWLAAFVATHVPLEKLPALHVGDERLHVFGFFALTTVFFWTLLAHGHSRPRRMLIIPPAMTLYAGLDELTQPLVNRCAAWSDWAADLVGAVAAIAIWELVLTGVKILRGRRNAKLPARTTSQT